jgi:hypothetical protein
MRGWQGEDKDGLKKGLKKQPWTNIDVVSFAPKGLIPPSLSASSAVS